MLRNIVSQNTGTLIALPESDFRNIESHHRQHNDIQPDHCDMCGEDFKYNSQSKLRKKCTGLNVKFSRILKLSALFMETVYLHYLWKQYLSSIKTKKQDQNLTCGISLPPRVVVFVETVHRKMSYLWK